MREILWVAARVIREVGRTRRTLAFFLVVPVAVMTLIYFALLKDEKASVTVVSRGAARLFDGEFVEAIAGHKDAVVVPPETIGIGDLENDPERLDSLIRSALETGATDGVLLLDDALLNDRFAGKAGTVRVFVEGSRPLRTATVLSAISESMDELASGLPTIIAADCSAYCADSVNSLPMEIEQVYLHGDDDDRMIDFFLPVFPPFFIFFFTFLISTVEFQRERVRGTLDRILIAPVGFGHVIAGYTAGFFVFAGLQSVIVLAFILKLIQVDFTAAQVAGLALVLALVTLVALLLGLLASFQAQNEFQAIQFVPLVILPQIFLSDLIWDIRSFPAVLRWLSQAMPLTYANHAARDILIRGRPLAHSWPELLALAAFLAAAFGALLLVARRRMRQG